MKQYAVIEPFNFKESVETIKNNSMFPMLELIPLLEREIKNRIYGDVTVSIGAFKSINIRIANKEFVFGYSINKNYLYDNIGIVVDDCLMEYQKAIIKRYFKFN